MQLRPGARLRSVTSTAELIVIRIPAEGADLRCDGLPLAGPDEADEPRGATSGEILLGKRYSNEDGTVELLCTKPGTGVLSVGDVPLGVKAPKAMPASD